MGIILDLGGGMCTAEHKEGLRLQGALLLAQLQEAVEWIFTLGKCSSL